MRHFTLLTLISVQKTYYFDLPSCVGTNLPSCLAREMAMICGQETDYFKPSCVARNIAMICGHKTNLPSCVAREMAMICGHTTYLSSCLAREMVMINYCKPSCVPRQRATISGQKTNLSSESKTGIICGLGNLWRCDSRDLIVSSPNNRLEKFSVAQFSFGKQNKLISCKIGSVCNSGNQINRKFIPEGRTQPSCRASINSTLDNDYLCSFKFNVNSSAAGLGRIQNSPIAVKPLDKFQSAIKTTKKRKREFLFTDFSKF